MNVRKSNGSNNVYYKQGCPALMEDARFITTYNSTNELTNQMQRMNNINNSNQFRQFLQQNAEQIMNSEREYQIKTNTCTPNISCSEGFYEIHNQLNTQPIQGLQSGYDTYGKPNTY